MPDVGARKTLDFTRNTFRKLRKTPYVRRQGRELRPYSRAAGRVFSELTGLGRFNPFARRLFVESLRSGGDHEQVAGAGNSHYHFEHTGIGP